MINENTLNEINNLNKIHTTWRDYALMLLNSSNKILRNNWRKKLITMIIHSEFYFNSFFETHLIGLSILKELPNDFTRMIVDDYWDNGYEIRKRSPASKRIKIKLGHLPQDSIDNEAICCLNFILDNWEKYNHLIFESEYLTKIWNFSQKSKGKCLFADEILTYQLEKDIDNSKDYWIKVCNDIFTNGLPSNKFKKYYFSNKIDWYLNNTSIPEDIEDQKYYFSLVYNKILKEDIQSCPSWKKVCICILKNDITWKYAGFQPTYKERMSREECLQAYRDMQKG